jgi:hypothetical protein
MMLSCDLCRHILGDRNIGLDESIGVGELRGIDSPIEYGEDARREETRDRPSASRE